MENPADSKSPSSSSSGWWSTAGLKGWNKETVRWLYLKLPGNPSPVKKRQDKSRDSRFLVYPCLLFDFFQDPGAKGWTTKDWIITTTASQGWGQSVLKRYLCKSSFASGTTNSMESRCVLQKLTKNMWYLRSSTSASKQKLCMEEWKAKQTKPITCSNIFNKFSKHDITAQTKLWVLFSPVLQHPDIGFLPTIREQKLLQWQTQGKLLPCVVICWSFPKSRSLFDLPKSWILRSPPAFHNPFISVHFDKALKCGASSIEFTVAKGCLMFVRQSPVVVQVQFIYLQKKLSKPRSLQTKGFLKKKWDLEVVLEKENPGLQAIPSAAMCLHAQFLGVVRTLQQVVQGPEVLWLSGLEEAAQITHAKLWSLNMLVFEGSKESQ